ncbi:MAG: hypothetical protein DRP15_01390 [Candidatus Aenigmatarchaeota archaeon]|nr:MAG: hypothetical protein DRP15_01390 [Candidatus Aenigmarchaeota archaeon]
MNKNLLILGTVVILTIVGVLGYKNLIKEKKPSFPTSSLEISMSEQSLQNKKVAMIIAFRDFRDPEYFVPKQILENAGAEIKTVSTQQGVAIGADGGEAPVDILLEDLNPAEFDAVVFIGGPGCLKYLDNATSYKIAQETIAQNKVLASICISPVILAKAGVLKDKKATVWSSIMDKSPVRILQEYGAIYQDKPVVTDGKIITGNGPSSAEEFGKAIVNSII